MSEEKSKKPASVSSVSYREIQKDDLARVFELETASYPEDEAASLDSLNYRFNNCPEFFLIAEAAGAGGKKNIVGFVNGTLGVERKLDHETMFKHAKAGKYLCIHSVVVDERLRRQKLGSVMLKEYVARIKAMQTKKEAAERLSSVLLICKQRLISFYQSAGFVLCGESDVVHGKDQWYECELKL